MGMLSMQVHYKLYSFLSHRALLLCGLWLQGFRRAIFLLGHGDEQGDRHSPNGWAKSG